MSQAKYFKWIDLSVVDVDGADAAVIVNNLTTNEVIKVPESSGRETFITDVRGKTLGHVLLMRGPDSIRLIGSPGQSEAIANQIERYTIREDATPQIRDDEFVGFVMSAQAVEVANLFAETPAALHAEPVARFDLVLAGLEIPVYRNGWLGNGTALLLVTKQNSAAVESELATRSLLAGTVDEFHAERIDTGFPWYGIDLDASNLPQELDRDRQAISFTKGCYLGQETVARLDALGQVQRKLVRWQIDAAAPPPGAPLMDQGKQVGRLTSIAPQPGGASIALGFARRSHFEAGATATGTDSVTGTEFTATVS